MIPEPESAAGGNHFSCSMSAVLLARVHAFGGEQAVGELLALAGSERSPEYLLDITNWISYDEAIALWRAGTDVTHHPEFARAVGEDAAERLNASPVAALLRSLGSPENVYRADRDEREQVQRRRAARGDRRRSGLCRDRRHGRARL